MRKTWQIRINRELPFCDKKRKGRKEEKREPTLKGEKKWKIQEKEEEEEKKKKKKKTKKKKKKRRITEKKKEGGFDENPNISPRNAAKSRELCLSSKKPVITSPRHH